MGRLLEMAEQTVSAVTFSRGSLRSREKSDVVIIAVSSFQYNILI